MAALSEVAGTRRDYVTGNVRGCQTTATAATFVTNNTWQPGLRIIETVDVTLQGSDSTTTWSAAISGGTITFTVANNPSSTVIVQAWGY